MKKLMMIAGAGALAGVGIMLAWCGENSMTEEQPPAKTVEVASVDSAQEIAMKKLKEAGFEKVEFVSEKITGNQSLIIAKVTAFGKTEETKIYCTKVGEKWTVTKLD